jgi:hypothetical protein
MKRKMLVGVVLLFLGITISVISCKKTETTAVTEEVNNVSALAAKFTAPIAADYQDVMKQYQNLSESELKAFWLEINKINNKTSPVAITPAEYEKLFDKFNNKSKSDFGVAMNKLSNKNLNILVDNRDNTKNEVAAKPPVDDGGGGGTGTCIFYAYPINLYENNNLAASPPFFTHTIVDYWPGDCDGVEAVYAGIWNASKSLTPLGIMTGPVYPIGRYVSGNTRALFKKSVMLLAFGSIQNINLHKRMANGTIIIESK